MGRHGKPILVAAAADLFEGVWTHPRQTAYEAGDVAFEPTNEPERHAIPGRQIELRLDASREDLFQLDTPLDDLVAPMISRLIEAGKFELEKMLDDVLTERSRRTEIAASQILDLSAMCSRSSSFPAGGSRRSNAACCCVQA